MYVVIINYHFLFGILFYSAYLKFYIRQTLTKEIVWVPVEW